MCYSVPMRFQGRDGRMISAIHRYGGVLARRHLKGMFWHDATLRAAQKRLIRQDVPQHFAECQHSFPHFHPSQVTRFYTPEYRQILPEAH